MISGKIYDLNIMNSLCVSLFSMSFINNKIASGAFLFVLSTWIGSDCDEMGGWRRVNNLYRRTTYVLHHRQLINTCFVNYLLNITIDERKSGGCMVDFKVTLQWRRQQWLAMIGFVLLAELWQCVYCKANEGAQNFWSWKADVCFSTFVKSKK